jgi:hypothetical protein
MAINTQLTEPITVNDKPLKTVYAFPTLAAKEVQTMALRRTFKLDYRNPILLLLCLSRYGSRHCIAKKHKNTPLQQ